MTAQAIAKKFRSALRNGTGVTLTREQVVMLRELGCLEAIGIFQNEPKPGLKPLSEPWPETPVVYFVGPHDGPVKIGFSTSLHVRFSDLKYMSPTPLHVWAVAHGSVALEKEYHRRFASARLHGEWFERTPELITELEQLTLVTT